MDDSIRPHAIFGGPLVGDFAMRYIFVDEAGTSEKEPITVVVGIIAHADAHVMIAEALLKEALGGVPLKFQDNFVFHATDVWNSKAYRDDWMMTDRLSVLGNVMRIPRRIGMAVSMGMIRKETGSSPDLEGLGLSLEQQHHVISFLGCLGRADKYIREYGDAREVATVVAEDVDQMRKHLREIPSILARPTSPIRSKELLHPTLRDKMVGYIGQETEMRVTRIRKSIHFVKKGDDPLIQIADACAFGFRRFFAGLDHGLELVHAILGGVPEISDFAEGMSFKTFFFHPDKKQMDQGWTAMS